MIPVTYPSSVSTSKESQMVVYSLSSVAGLQRWTDYIPVKYQSTGSDVPNSFNTNGYIACDFITNLTGKQAWVDYIPVFVDNLATTAWQVSDTGFIPFNTLAGGGTYVSLDLNFLNTTALDSRITFSRGTNATLTDSNGRIAWAPHNLMTNSEDFEAAAWINQVAGAGTTPVRTANADVAPDGTLTADRLQFNLGGGTTTGDQSYISQSAVITQDSIFSIWLRSNTGSNVNLYLRCSNSANTITVTPTWQRFSVVGVLSAGAIHGFGLRGGSSPANSNTADVLAWGAQLNVANAPVNLLTWSEQFDNAAWTRTLCTVTANTTTAPDATLTADTVTDNSTSGTELSQTATVSSGATVSHSRYFKYINCQWIRLVIGGATDFIRGWFDIQNGVVGATSVGGVGTGATINITNVGNGWYRCTLGGALTGLTSYSVISMTADGNNVTNRVSGGSYYVWGAQLNTGSVALPYVATTSSIYLPPAYNSTTPKNLLGFTQEPENAAWTKSNSYVQQNLLTWSQDFDNAAWVKVQLNITGTPAWVNVTTAPDGTTTADKLIAFNSASDHTVVRTDVTGANTYTLSVYAKASEYSFVALWLFQATTVKGVLFNVSTGAFVSHLDSSNQVTSYNVTPVGNGYFRLTITATLTLAQCGISLSDSATPSFTASRLPTFTGDNTSGAFIWGAQLVQGSTAGDYTQTTSAAAPTRYLNWDGTLTGRKLVEDTATSTHQAYQNYAAPATGLPLTLSVYAKAAERTVLTLIEPNGIERSYNLVTGVATGSGASMQSAGGGWWRCIAAGTAPDTATRSYGMRLNNGTTTSYTGDGTSGIYVSDFQLSNSASVDPYVYNPQAAAASAAYYGPRFDYDPVTLAAKGLLIEEQRTNLLTYSEQFDNASWTKTAATITANTIVAPDGTLTGDKFIPDATTAQHAVAAGGAFASVAYTTSVYAKAGEYRYATVNRTSGAAIFYAVTVDLQTGLVTQESVSGNTSYSTTVTNAGNGWWRIATYGSATSGNFVVISGHNSATYTPASFGMPSFTGDGYSGIYIWGAQLEAGSFATSYIPTVASQVTRNADSASMLGDNFYTWFNPNQGTLSAEVTPYGVLSDTRVASLQGTNNRILIWGGTTSNQARYEVITNGSTEVNLSINNTFIANATTKAAAAYKVNDFAFSANGGAVVTDTSGQVPVNITVLNIGGSTGVPLPSGAIRRINYYNTRLPDSTLQAMTT